MSQLDMFEEYEKNKAGLNRKVKKSDEVAEEMLNFLSNSLAGKETYKFFSKKRIKKNGFNHFIRSDDLSTIIMLLHETYTETNFKRIKSKLESYNYENVVFLPVKDGINYFRSASFTHKNDLKSIEYKKNNSLSNYSHDDFKRMITLSPIELAINKSRGWEVIYFQPESKKLEEKIVKFEFSPIIYTNFLKTYDGLIKEEKISTKRFLWLPQKREEHESGIYFNKNKVFSSDSY